MVSSYTQNNGIEKPGVGEQNNTWGITANTNYDILDRAANGVGTVPLTGTTSNLSTLDGSLSDGQYKVLLLTGALGATHTITILPNDLKKMYMVYNLTGQSIVFTQGSGGNVTIANTDSAMIYCTGAGATSAVVNLADHLAMSSVKITGGAITGGSITGVSLSGLSAPLPVADGGTGGNTAAAARTALGLGTMATLNTGTAGGEFRTNTQSEAFFQPLDAQLTSLAGLTTVAPLTSIAGLTTVADRMIYTTASDVYAVATLNAAGRASLAGTVSTSFTAGTNAQGQGPIPAADRVVVVNTTAANPSGVTLPTLVSGENGKQIVIYNRGTNQINVYPASGATISGGAADVPLKLAIGFIMRVEQRSSTQWLCSIAPAAPDASGRILGTNDALDAIDWVTGPKPNESGLITLTGTSTNLFTGLSAGVKRINVWARGVQGSSTGYSGLQLGTGGAFVTSGYTRANSSRNSSDINSTSRFVEIGSNAASTTTWDVAYTLKLVNGSGTAWICDHRGSTDAVSGLGFVGAGSIVLAGDLDRIRFAMSTGSYSSGFAWAEWFGY
jgi:hypothetical protein